jgi:hypothetical protein
MSNVKTVTTSLNIDQLKEMVKYIIVNNRFIQSQGMVPTTIAVEGGSGIGKTSTAIQIGQELGLDVVKINLAQIEELGDLVGFPIRQFQMEKDGDVRWADEHAVGSYTKLDYQFTGNNRTANCPPEWIADKKRGGILIIDDFNRADARFMQAMMELVDRQTYMGWKLPEDWHIMLTNNPDNGDYNVTSLDNAQRTRFIGVNLKFDIDCWGRWAEASGVDSRCINFLLLNPETVTDTVNARSITTFFNATKSIERFEEKLPLIQMIGEGSVGMEFSTLFTLFINNKLDKLMSPKDILFGDNLDSVINKLKGDIGSGKGYRADIASTISTRVVNFALLHAETNTIDKTFIERVSDLVKSDVFANDLKFNIVKKMYNGNKAKFKLLTMDKALTQYVLA